MGRRREVPSWCRCPLFLPSKGAPCPLLRESKGTVVLSAGRLSVRRGSAAGLCASSLRARWGWAVGQAALPGWGPWAGEAAGKVSQRGETSLPAERGRCTAAHRGFAGGPVRRVKNPFRYTVWQLLSRYSWGTVGIGHETFCPSFYPYSLSAKNSEMVVNALEYPCACSCPSQDTTVNPLPILP